MKVHYGANIAGENFENFWSSIRQKSYSDFDLILQLHIWFSN